MESIVLVKDAASCCGCGACLSVCAKQAISMKADPLGCLFPEIDASRCIRCGKCVQICAYAKAEPAVIPIATYAAVGKCEETVKMSASGGIFATLAESFIRRGGAVAGAVMDFENAHANVYHLLSDSFADLCRMQGSKYVQSEAWRCYPQVLRTLQAGKPVLFSGTPCQVAAVKELTGNPENLITVDLVCHGVPPVQMFNDYLKILSKRVRGRITQFRFRDKSCPKTYTSGIDVCRKETTGRFLLKSSLQSFYSLFLNGSIHRENCYSCPYARSSRISDITIGDYWGIAQFHAEDMKNGGMPQRTDWSCVLVNTEKGARFLEEYGENLFLHRSRLEWAAKNNRQLNEPAKKGENREAVLEAYKKRGYGAVEAMFIQDNGGWLRYGRRLIRNFRENNQKKYEN